MTTIKQPQSNRGPQNDKFSVKLLAGFKLN